MLKTLFFFLFIGAFILAIPSTAQSQTVPNDKDTFFLLKKKGLLGELGKSISKDGTEKEPLKKVNPYLRYTGKIIRHIRIVRLGFERNINDTTKYHNNFGNIAANAFHKRTREKVVRNNLFFDEGERVQPYMMADNERNLREQPYVQDALIKIEPVPDCIDSVDVLVLEKDVFSIGGSADIASPQFGLIQVQDENFGGAGTRLQVSALYDAARKPTTTFGVDLLKRNIKGSFINWEAGFTTFNYTQSSGRKQEAAYYTILDKPLVSPYIRTVGSLLLSYNQTKNYYDNDSVYLYDVRYKYSIADGWFGYNFDADKIRANNLESRIKRLIAFRGFYMHYNQLPQKVLDSFDYRYANIRGVLGSFIVFKQNFYRANFIYGFGRNEDVPQGFNVSLVAGWVIKKDSISNSERKRPYYGIDATMSRYNDRGFYSNYTFRLGGYRNLGSWEDVNLLMYVEHFSKRVVLSDLWYFREFINFGFTKQFSRVLNQPLYLRSVYGLPYFSNGTINAQTRISMTTESVFYNMRKFWGFRFAPLAFTGLCLIQPNDMRFNQSDLYSAVGAGVRTRNENLIFGTIELRAYYFPRTVPGMNDFKVEINTNLQFKYNSTYIRKPDFIIAN